MIKNSRGVALVTGANRGIGRLVALSLARRGLRVLLGCRSPERGRDALAALHEVGGEEEVLPLDLTDTSSIPEAAQRSCPRRIEQRAS